jgi:hypothetical protein
MGADGRMEQPIIGLTCPKIASALLGTKVGTKLVYRSNPQRLVEIAALLNTLVNLVLITTR